MTGLANVTDRPALRGRGGVMVAFLALLLGGVMVWPFVTLAPALNRQVPPATIAWRDGTFFPLQQASSGAAAAVSIRPSRLAKLLSPTRLTPSGARWIAAAATAAGAARVRRVYEPQAPPAQLL